MSIFKGWRKKRTQECEMPGKESFESERKVNPYLPYIREILEEILIQRKFRYGSMRLVIIDTDTEPESLLDEDDMEVVLRLLSMDLNYLTIFTNRPAYFDKYVETMYEEHGLLVNLTEKRNHRKLKVNAVVDLERRGELWDFDLAEPFIYLPIYKKRWETTENLDICVPIGYKTVIAKGIRVVEKRGRVLQ